MISHTIKGKHKVVDMKMTTACNVKFIYDGQVLNDNTPHGYGQAYYDGLVREDFSRVYWEDDFNRYIGKKNSYSGYWKNGLKHGEGTMTFNNGDFIKGHWVNDWLQSEVVIYDKWNDVKYQGNIFKIINDINYKEKNNNDGHNDNPTEHFEYFVRQGHYPLCHGGRKTKD